MTSIRSKLNALLRRLAAPVSPRNPLRQFASRQWTRFLSQTGGHIEVPLAGTTINMLNEFRNISPDYEAETFKLWRKLVQPGCVVWDVGANIGVYSVISAKIVGESGEVQAWEPAQGNRMSTVVDQ